MSDRVKFSIDSLHRAVEYRHVYTRLLTIPTYTLHSNISLLKWSCTGFWWCVLMYKEYKKEHLQHYRLAFQFD